MNQLVLSKQLQNGRLETPWASKMVLNTFPERPQALPERLRDASRAPRARPRSDQRVLKSSRGVQKSFRELKILPLDAPRPSNCKLSSIVFRLSQTVVRQCIPERVKCGLATSSSCPSAPQVSSWPRRGSRSANNFQRVIGINKYKLPLPPSTAHLNVAL